MQKPFLSCIFAVVLAAPLAAQTAEFDPADFGKIIVAPRQAAGGGLVLEQAFGDYQNEPVTDYGENSIARRLGRPVGRLDVLYKDNKTAYCTAFIVDDQHLLTNNHCIPGLRDVGVQAAQFVTGYLESGQSDKAEKFQVAIEPVETSANLDYSVLRVFGDPSARYGLVELADADPEPSEFLWIIGHPQGQVQHISREGCAAADPAVSGEGKVVHSCDTLGGNSGSPVFRITDRHVVALHHAGDSRTGFNFAIPMRRILKNSSVLKAAAPVAPPVAPPAELGACEVLWAAAEQHGCLGFRTFLTQCGSHPLAVLAQGLAERSCSADDDPVVVDNGGPDQLTDDPVDTAAQARLDDLRKQADAATNRIQTVGAELDTLQLDFRDLLKKAQARAFLSERSPDPGSPAVAALWTDLATTIQTDQTRFVRAAKSLARFSEGVDTVMSNLDKTASAQAVTRASGQIKGEQDAANDILRKAVARKEELAVLLDEGEKTAADLRAAARRQADIGAPDSKLKTELKRALAPNSGTQRQLKYNLSIVEGVLADLTALKSEADQLARSEGLSTNAANKEIAALWRMQSTSTAIEIARTRTAVADMRNGVDDIDSAVSELRADPNVFDADLTEIIAAIDDIVAVSNESKAVGTARLASVDQRFVETADRVEQLAMESTLVPNRPAIVTRCLELSMPQFSVEGIEGVPTPKFNEDAAEQACSAAQGVSDDPAITYGLARALYEKKRYQRATTMFREAGNEGFVPALYHLGVAHNSGRGVAKDFGAAIRLFRETSAEGFPQGKFSLGVYYSIGRGVQTDHRRAGDLLLESIVDGYAHTITQLNKLPNATIREIQNGLVRRGLLRTGDVDGAFGPTTRSALERLLASNTR